MQTVSKIEMQDLDERMIHQYKIPLSNMMESAGKGLTRILTDRYPKAKRVLVAAGTGNIGGGGIVAARLLHEKGIDVRILFTRSEMFLKPVAKVKYDKLPDEIMVGLTEEAEDDELRSLLRGSDVIIDALLGYSATEDPQGEVGRLITCINDCGTPVVSLDLPSGLDADEGAIYEPLVKADVTATLGLVKRGLTVPSSREYVGSLYVVDIHVPDVWYEQESVERPSFNEQGILLLTE